MIQQIDFDTEKVMGWRIGGKINQEEFKPLIDSIAHKLEARDQVSIYMELPETPGITPKVLWESLKSGFSNLRKYNNKLNRVAVVTDKNWLQSWTNIEDRLFPGIEEKPFAFEEAQEARQWVQQMK